MDISISNLENKIKEIFIASKVRSVDWVYEKSNNPSELKLVISINRILYEDVNVIYTKFIFLTDSNKTKLVKNNFSYLYDINCEYIYGVDFLDLNDLEKKISNIFKNDKFGKDIKILSKFIKSPSTLINEWFRENGITDLSIANVNEKKITMMPCELLYFNFTIDLNNNQSVELYITKEKKKKYVYKFELNNNIYVEEQTDLNRLIETIGDSLKNKIQM